MSLQLKDRIKFALRFFKAMKKDAEVVSADVCRTETDDYEMFVTTDQMDAGFDERLYG